MFRNGLVGNIAVAVITNNILSFKSQRWSFESTIRKHRNKEKQQPYPIDQYWL